MDIYFLIEDISLGGGGERVVSLLSNHLKKLNYNVKIITCMQTKKNLKFKYDVEIINLNIMYKKKNKIEKLKFWGKILLKLRALTKNESVIILGIGLEMNIVLSFLNKKIKKIGCEHTSYSIQSYIMKMIRNVRYKKLTQIVSLTNHDLKLYKKINQNSIVIRNPLTYNPLNSNILNNKELVVCLVGRLSSEKQFDKIIPIIKKIIERHPKWRFEIYGEGTEKDKLINIINRLNLKKHVILKGNVSNIQDELKKKSIFILCSKYEGLPMSLLESMSCGVASISFDCETGPKEIIKNGINGILVKNQNFEELGNEVLRVIEDEKLRKKLQLNSLYTLEKFRLERIIKKWENLFEGM